MRKTPTCIELQGTTHGPRRNETYSVTGYQEQALAFVSIAQPGTYRLIAQTADPAAAAPTVVTLGTDTDLRQRGPVAKGLVALLLAGYAAIAFSLLNWRLPSPETAVVVQSSDTTPVAGKLATEVAVAEADEPAADAQSADITEPATGPGLRYPIEAGFERDRARSRLWAIPIVGGFVKILVLVPHFVALAVLGLLFNPLVGHPPARLAQRLERPDLQLLSRFSA